MALDNPLKLNFIQADAVKGFNELNVYSIKYKFLETVHRIIRPQVYLQIGVRDNEYLGLATCESIAIDLIFNPTISNNTNVKLYRTTTDGFFQFLSDKALVKPVDLFLIDGLPLIESVVHDVMHCERHAHPASLLIVANMFPRFPEQATRWRQGRDWLGDAWKLPALLASERPDLFILPVDVGDYGALLVAGLDPLNEQLRNTLTSLRQKSAEESHAQPSVEILARKGATPATHPVVMNVLNTILEARQNFTSATELVAQLRVKAGLSD